MRIALLAIAVSPLLAFAAFSNARSEGFVGPERSASAVREASLADRYPGTERATVSIPGLIAKDFDGRGFEIGETLAETDAYTRYAISYLSGDLKITGIMNVPRGDGPFPVLILNHGYIHPDVYTTGQGLKREQDLLARRGFVVVHPDYRNHAGSDDDPENDVSVRFGYVEDVINAAVAVREAGLPFADASRIGMMGHSMGGGITQNAAVIAPELVDAVVLYASVSGDHRDNFTRHTTNFPFAKDILAKYGDFEEAPEFWHDISPANFYDRVDAPFLVHIGTADKALPPEWSWDIRDRLEAAGKDVALHVYEGEPHEFGTEWDLMIERTADFFDASLRGA